MAAGRAADRASVAGYAASSAPAARSGSASRYAATAKAPAPAAPGPLGVDKQKPGGLAQGRAIDRASVPAYAGSTVRDQLVEGAKQVSARFGGSLTPRDVLAMVSYETAGTFDPGIKGPTTQWGQHIGLFQAGTKGVAKEMGITTDTPALTQMQKMGDYLEQRGFRPGMGVKDAYSAINAGRVGRYGATDENNGGAPGTVAEKVDNQFGGHYAKADSLLGGAIDPKGSSPATTSVMASAAPTPSARPATGLTPDMVAASAQRFAQQYLGKQAAPPITSSRSVGTAPATPVQEDRIQTAKADRLAPIMKSRDVGTMKVAEAKDDKPKSAVDSFMERYLGIKPGSTISNPGVSNRDGEQRPAAPKPIEVAQADTGTDPETPAGGTFGAPMFDGTRNTADPNRTPGRRFGGLGGFRG